MSDNELAKLAKVGKANSSKPTWTLVRKMDVNITGEQAYWIKYRTWSHKKKKKGKKCSAIFINPERAPIEGSVNSDVRFPLQRILRA